jgi:hypothetical protein
MQDACVCGGRKMSKRKQSLNDQLRRVDQFCCPIHGVPFDQEEGLAESISIAVCSRKDCRVYAVVDAIREGDAVDLQVRHLITPEQLHRMREVYWNMMRDAEKQAGIVIAAELEKIAASPEVQLPVAG